MNRPFMFAMILVIGDSHTYQSFGRRLDVLLRKLPQTRVATYASWGSLPDSWSTGWPCAHGHFERDPDGNIIDVPSAPTPIFTELLARHRPDLTIIALGSNLFGAPLEYSAESARRMAQAAVSAGSRCLWVGPPDSRARAGMQMDALYGTLRDAVSPYCEFLDSRPLTHYPAVGGDGLHYDYLGLSGQWQTRVWARAVFDDARALLPPSPAPKLNRVEGPLIAPHQ